MYAQREIAYVQDDEKKRSKLFWEIFFFRCITMAISIIAFYFTYASHGEYQLYYKILIIQLFANVLDISWFFQGLEEFKIKCCMHFYICKNTRGFMDLLCNICVINIIRQYIIVGIFA